MSATEREELERFESELEGLRPAKPPEAFVRQLTAALPKPHPTAKARPGAGWPSQSWGRWFGWLAPIGTAAALVAVLMNGRPGPPAAKIPGHAQNQPAATPLKADRVEIDQHLVGAFDTVARLPSGEPVRLRCRQWSDEVVLRDSARGITVERRTPRLEVVPVSFETY